MELNGKKVVIAGLGTTGRSLVPFLTARGARVTVSDRRPKEHFGAELTALEPYNVRWDLGGHTAALFTGADLVIVSPGVPIAIPAIAAASAGGVPVMGEIELAARFLTTPMAAITGTNGKSTTVSLLGHLAETAGLRAFVGGNFGTPLIDYVSGPQADDLAVVELSSFQLETVHDFHARWATVINITPDHLDRYPDIRGYAEAKRNVFVNQTKKDLAVLNLDDPVVRAMADGLAGRTLFFSRLRRVERGAFMDGDTVVLAADELHAELRVPTAGSALIGAHNHENMMAALLMARDAGMDGERLIEGIRTYRPLAHRVEFVADVDGISFYDDSKGTNMGAVAMALEGMDRPVVLILGGRNKGSDFHYLSDVVRRKVRSLVTVGEAGPEIHEALKNVVDSRLAESFESAVDTAYRLAVPGDAVLLSPGCASFDMFHDYGHRGRVFQELVKGLAARA